MSKMVKKGRELTRRQFVNLTALGLAGCATSVLAVVPEAYVLRIAQLHMNVEVGDLDGNCARLHQAINLAADHGAKFLVTPELSLSGYRFAKQIGTDWISIEPDRWTKQLMAAAAERQVSLFLGHAERDVDGLRCYNTLFGIDRMGRIVGRHHKINTIPGSESWSSRGAEAKTVQIDGLSIGLLICADAWPQRHAARLKAQGAQLLISGANWSPGLHGPGDTWERRSAETCLPLFVTNRTGQEGGLDMRHAQSIVSFAGSRLYTHSSDNSAVVLLDWDLAEQRLLANPKVFLL